jgi:hypothetical protein
MEVSTESPLRIAVTEQPLPSWRVMSRESSMLLPEREAQRWLMSWCARP